MKKLIAVFAFILIIFFTFGCIATINNRTLSKQLPENISIDIFIPSGLADEYRNTLAMTFDDGRVWLYSLSEEESELIKRESEIEKWTRFTPDEHNMFFRYTETDIPNGELYAYTPEDKRSLLFVFDSTNCEYYCFSVSI